MIKVAGRVFMCLSLSNAASFHSVQRGVMKAPGKENEETVGNI